MFNIPFLFFLFFGMFKASFTEREAFTDFLSVKGSQQIQQIQHPAKTTSIQVPLFSSHTQRYTHIIRSVTRRIYYTQGAVGGPTLPVPPAVSPKFFIRNGDRLGNNENQMGNSYAIV